MCKEKLHANNYSKGNNYELVQFVCYECSLTGIKMTGISLFHVKYGLCLARIFQFFIPTSFSLLLL